MASQVKRWTPEEDALIEQMYLRESTNQIQKFMPHRKRSAIDARARKLFKDKPQIKKACKYLDEHLDRVGVADSAKRERNKLLAEEGDCQFCFSCRHAKRSCRRATPRPQITTSEK